MTWDIIQVPGGVKSGSANCTCQILNLTIKTKTTFWGEQKLYKEQVYLCVYIYICQPAQNAARRMEHQHVHQNI